MRKVLMTIFMLLTLVVAGCGADASTSGSVQQNKAHAENSGRKVIMQFAEGQAVLILNNSKAADNLYKMLPLQLSFKDFNRTEKIAYPPRPVHEGLRSEGHKPAKGDLCLYAPWGNLCIFYRDYSMSADLFYLGRIEEGMELLENQKQDFAVKLIKG